MMAAYEILVRDIDLLNPSLRRMSGCGARNDSLERITGCEGAPVISATVGNNFGLLAASKGPISGTRRRLREARLLLPLVTAPPRRPVSKTAPVKSKILGGQKL